MLCAPTGINVSFTIEEYIDGWIEESFTFADSVI